MKLMEWDLDTTLGKLHRFWWWCVDYAENGDLRKHNDDRLGAASGVLPGQPSKRFVAAMVAACWLDRKPYFRVHDWWDYFGMFLQRKYSDQREKWESVRLLYSNKTGTVQLLSPPTNQPKPTQTNQPTNQPTKNNLPRSFDDAVGDAGFCDQLQRAYPGVHLNTEVSKMRAWLAANPAKAKKRQWKRFVNGWLNRTQEATHEISRRMPQRHPDPDRAAALGAVVKTVDV